MDLYNELERLLGSGHVEDCKCGKQELFPYSETCEPAAVVRINSSEEAEKLIKWANETETPIVPCSSAAPHYRGGSAPAVNGAVVADLSGMKKIISINKQQRMAVVEAGVTYEELLPELAKHGMTLNMSLAPKAGKSVLASLTEIEPRLNCVRQWNYVEPLRCLEVVWGNGHRMFTGDAYGGPLDLELQQSKGKWQLDAPGPMNVDYYRLVAGARGSMGLATWVSVRCELLPIEHRSFIAGSDVIAPLLELARRIIRNRFSDELFILNNTAVKRIVGDAADNLPEWIAVIGVAGRDAAYHLRVQGQCLDISDMASDCGLKLIESENGIDAEQILQTASSPCEPGKYWRTDGHDTVGEQFMTTTLDKVPCFIDAFKEFEKDLPSKAAVYVQPQHQGVCCQLSFSVPCNFGAECDNVSKILKKAGSRMDELGAYYSRPYGEWAKIQRERDAATMHLLRGAKDIFDPNGIMNPGKLWDRQGAEK